MGIRLYFTIMCFALCLGVTTGANEVKMEECEDTCSYSDYEMDCTWSACSYIPANIDMTIIRGYYYMETLLLNNNTITNVTAFPEYASLEKLDLSSCNIKTLEMNAFKNLGALEVLILAYNELATLDKEHFAGLDGHLKQLDLKGNKFTNITDNVFFAHLGSVERLDLSNNKIHYISANGFTDIEKLRFLHLDHNQLDVIDNKDFLGLKNLEDLHLQHNSIKRIDEFTFSECENLEMVDLSNNQIQFMSENAFRGLDKLKILRLQRNQISQIKTEIFDDLTIVEHIYLDYNPIKTIESGSFPPSIQRISMQNMNELQLINNGTFTNLSQLHTVEITNCKNLVLIDVGAFNQHNTTLKVLNLCNNALKTLYETLVNWTVIQDLKLGKNRWVCDCEMAWVKHTGQIPEEVSNDMKCYEPHHLHGKRVSDVDYTQFSCAFYDVHRGGIEAGIILMVTVLFVSLGMSLAYKFRYTVFPCFFNSPGKYSTMYNAVNMEEEDAVEIKFKKETEHIIPGPTPV